MSNIALNDKIVAVSNLLEQIESINGMIHLHQERGEEGSFMADQYQSRKMSFTNELRHLLLEFELNFVVEKQAA